MSFNPACKWLDVRLVTQIRLKLIAAKLAVDDAFGIIFFIQIKETFPLLFTIYVGIVY